ncbi:MAG: DUF502 domain-containing protein [Sedimenticola sp.]|uniref:DUF502 domain-containing protein n=1 Tax=Sedimenticola thiotaurini TaxID=1543721 RepID=A0A558D0T4_9GAMM|nr:DUF502 domain-containing protein [Sedimenticola sp.]TVT54583.1 MAG: DUF502 domain-containing protein [Sedimenticola thiotaurini]MCW8921750.1 DUF502 domain-containing protein [Sedimenticola sp.]MCW8947144.1 DUF502 domain-containing protein [Sedimenticola sp.]MCW8950982.1 DUF502 domain-containing protein [Sedimenticola sp.]
MRFFRRYLVAGLLVWVPLGITLLVVRMLVRWLDGTLQLVPEAYRPENLLGFNIPGIGVVLSLLIVFVTGVLVANLFGRSLVSVWEQLLARIPLVRSIYSGAKQLAETMFSEAGQSFRKVLLIEFPRKGLWTLAFQTGTDVGEAQLKTGQNVINVYVPTTPNPTGGYFVMVPREDVVELDMSVDDGLKMLMSMGAVVPNSQHSVPLEPDLTNASRPGQKS